MSYLKKVSLACLLISCVVPSSVAADLHKRKEGIHRDQKDSELIAGLLKGTGIALLFALGAVVTDKLANGISTRGASLEHQPKYGLIYGLLEGASAGFAVGTIPCVLSGISGKENSRAWFGMAISAPIIGAVTGGMVSGSVTSNARNLPVVGGVFNTLDSKNIHASSAATIGIVAVAVHTGIKPTIRRIQDYALAKFYRDDQHHRE